MRVEVGKEEERGMVMSVRVSSCAGDFLVFYCQFIRYFICTLTK